MVNAQIKIGNFSSAVICKVRKSLLALVRILRILRYLLAKSENLESIE